MIRFRDVGFAYPNGSPVINRLTLEIKKGERVCLFGRNGTGKSTLLKLIAGLLLPSTGEIAIDGILTTDQKHLPEIRRRVGFIFQNPEDQIVATSVEADIAFTLENLGVEQKLMQDKVGRCAEKFGLGGMLKRHPLALSAGEKQRTALAGVMVVEPEILLLDEPTSFLDFRGRQTLFDLVSSSREQTVIAATQYVSEVQKYDRVILLDRGGYAFDGTRDEFERTDAWRDMSAVVARRGMVSVHVEVGEETSLRQGPVIEMRGVTFGYVTEKRVLQSVDVSVANNRISAVLGDSGCGKTTLALLLAGLVDPADGTMLLQGREVDSKELMKNVAVLFQFPEASFFADTAREEVAFGIKPLRLSDADTTDRVRGALALVGMDYDKFAERNPFTLSAGERRRVAIASALIMERPIIVFDETTLGLDWDGRRAMVKLVCDLRNAGKTIVLMTHDLEFVKQTADEMILMDQGKVVWQGPLDDRDRPQKFLQEHFGV